MRRTVVVGAGAIGSAIGALLMEAGQPSVLIARGDRGRRLQRSGLVIQFGNQPRRRSDVPVVTSLEEAEITPHDRVLICVKSQDMEEAIGQLRTDLPSTDIPICSAQNGIANEHAALRYWPRVYGMLIMVSASHGPADSIVVERQHPAGVIDIGRFPTGMDDFCRTFAADLRSAGFASRAVPDIFAWKSAKLLINLGSAVTMMVPSECKTRVQIIDAARAEARGVLAGAGVPLVHRGEWDLRAKDAFGPAWTPFGSGRQNSTMQSLSSGRSLETDFLNGEVVRLARLSNAVAPLNSTISRIAHAVSKRPRLAGNVSCGLFTDSVTSTSGSSDDVERAEMDRSPSPIPLTASCAVCAHEATSRL